MTPKFLARQLSHPSGPLGHLVAHLMNRGNARMNAFTVDQLSPAGGDRVLEIGFGGGIALPALIGKAGFVAGLDRSEHMVRRARARFSDAIKSGQAAFVHGQLEALPFEASSFNKVMTVNTVYFWKSLHAGLREIHRVLSPGGTVVVGFLPQETMQRMRMPSDIFTTRTAEELLTASEATGFVGLRVNRPDRTTPWRTIVASRSQA